MNYVSTRGQIKPIGFCDAVMMGLADDGGLIIPASIPSVSDNLDAWSRLSYGELALEVLAPFVSDIPRSDLKALIDRAYYGAFPPAVAPLVRIGPVHVLELWHGPTLAFKDMALQLLGNLFEYVLARTGGKLNILGATSGDTGSAAIYGVRGRKGIHIFVMHPRGRVSPIQERQMTTVLDANVHNIALEGSFDDCQRIMKDLAADLDFKRAYALGAVNSVNWARVLAQIVYYFWAWFRLNEQTGRAAPCRVAVPTGNFGDVLAGWYAKRMGLPISTLILATNENDILSRFFNTGEYSISQVHQTLSPSMDIQVASNFERYLYYKLGCDAGKLREMMSRFSKTGRLRVQPQADGTVDADFIAAAAGTENVLATIRAYYEKYRYVLDPHTAVGVAVAEKLEAADRQPTICLATAHPAKFPAAIQQATGRADLARHDDIDKLMNLPTRCAVLPNDKLAVREFIVKTLRK